MTVLLRLRAAPTYLAVAALSVAGTAAACLAAAAFADSTSSDEPPIFACVDKSGHLRVVDSAAACTSKETPLTWAVAGPPGPQGDPGEKGDPGASALGPKGFYEVESTKPTTDPNPGSGLAECDLGDVVVGGGFRGNQIAGNLVTFVDAPISGIAWQILLANVIPIAGSSVTTVAICADTSF